MMTSVLEEVEGLTKEVYFIVTLQEEDHFPCKISGSMFTSFDLGIT